MTAAAALVGAALAAACVAPAALGATIAVTTTADAVAADGACGLREAIAAANLDTATPGGGECPAGSPASPDRIVLGPGVFVLSRAGTGEDANAAGDLDVRGALVIAGAGAGSTTIDARGIDRVLDIGASAVVTLEGVTITGGAAPAGSAAGVDGGAGGILNRGDLTILASRVAGNVGGAGAAGAAVVGVVEPNGVDGAASTAGAGGAGGAGGIASDGPLALSDSVITGNRGGAGGPGGAATGGSAGPGPLGADGGDARGGRGGDGGGGGLVALGATTITRTAILDNRAGAGGRGGDAEGGSGAGGGDGGSGGDAIAGDGGDGGDGGGVLTTGTLTVRESAIASNLTAPGGPGGAGRGGARSGLANVLGAGTGGDGGAGGDGGGVAVAAGSADLLNTTIASNLTGGGGAGGPGGAGIPGGGPGSAGGAGGPGGSGGGVAGVGTLTAAFVTIAANGEGGGGTAGRAGDVSAPGASGPAGTPGAGASAAVRAEGPATLTRSILAGNGCVGTPAADGLGVAAGAPGCPGAAADPALGPLGANGGPTVSMRPGAGGGAIDRVPAGACPATDQRGALRPTGAACDAGAVELAPPGAVTGAPGLVGATDAGVAATVDTRGLPTEYYVDFGPTAAYGGRTAGVLIPGAAGPTAVSATLTGLAARTVYHYRVVAVGPDGTTAGADRTFETPIAVPAAAGTAARPRVLGLAVAPKAFAVLAAGARPTAATRARPARGARITVRMSARATLVLAVRRAAAGRRVVAAGTVRCVPLRPGVRIRASARCTRYPVIGTVRRVAAAGLSRFTFTGRLGGTALRPGAYRLEASALDALARPSAPVSVPFRMVSPTGAASRPR